MTDPLTDADLDAIEQRASQWASPLAIKCPSCGANPGDRCYGNGPMNRPHGERSEAARPSGHSEERINMCAGSRRFTTHDW